MGHDWHASPEWKAYARGQDMGHDEKIMQRRLLSVKHPVPSAFSRASMHALSSGAAHNTDHRQPPEDKGSWGFHPIPRGQ